MRTRTKAVLTIFMMLVGAILVTAGPASAEGKDEDNSIYSSYTVCHYKDGQFPYWTTLELSPEDTEWYLANYPNDFKAEQGCPGNAAVKICKQIDGWWDAVWVDPGSANWLLDTGQAKLVEDCKNPEQPTPTPEPEPTPKPEEPTPAPEEPTPAPEEPKVEEPTVEEPEVEAPVVEEEVAEGAEAPKPEAKTEPEVLAETVTRSELALTGTSTSDLAGYALMLIGAGLALSMGADRLRRFTV